MSNSNMDYLYPEFWASSFDMLDAGMYPLHNLVSRDTEGLIARAGDTINVPLAPDLDEADDFANDGSTITPTNISQQKVSVTLNKSKRKTIQLTGAELTKSGYDLLSVYGVSMAETILRTLNVNIYETMLAATNFVDGRTTFDETSIISMRTKLSNNKVPVSGRKLVCAPDDYGTMLAVGEFLKANESGTNEAMREGLLSRRLGFDIYETNAIETYTPVDLVGAVNFGAGYAAGTTTMVVDGFNDDANPIRVGDIFTCAGESGTPPHTVTATTTSSGDTISITFSPALTDAVADDDAITVVPTRSVLGFVPNAVALAVRANAVLPEGVGVRSSIVNYKGCPVRISVWSANLAINVQYDVLYGVSVARNERIARIVID